MTHELFNKIFLYLDEKFGYTVANTFQIIATILEIAIIALIITIAIKEIKKAKKRSEDNIKRSNKAPEK